MGEIHRHLAGEGGAWRTSRRRAQIGDLHSEHRRHGGIDCLPQLKPAAAYSGS